MAFQRHRNFKPTKKHHVQPRLTKTNTNTSNYDSWFRIFSLLSKFFFIYLAACGGVYSANAQLTTTGETKTETKEKVLKKICTDQSRGPINFPNFRAGGNGKTLVPLSCVHSQPECEQQKKELASFTYQEEQEKINEARKKIITDFRAWRAQTDARIAKVKEGLTPRERQIVDDVYANVKKLYSHFLSEKHFDGFKKLPCGDHAFGGLRKLLKEKLEYGLDLTLQLGVFSGPDVVNGFDNHAVIFIDSNGPDINIQKDKNAVHHYLQQFNEGKVCDLWNHGTYVSLKDDTSGLYGITAGYDSLMKETISLNFSEVANLPKKVQRLVCKLFESMGLDIEPRNICGVFSEKSAVQKDSLANEDTSKTQEAVKLSKDNIM